MSKLLLATLLLVPIVSAHAATLVIADENFDTAPVSGNGLNTGNGNVVLTTTVGDPTSSGHGNVASADLEAGGRWGEVRAQTQNIPIPVQSSPGVDTFSASLDVYIPGDTTYAETDRIGIILRWNGSNSNNNQVFFAWDSFATDTWETITLTGTLPVNGGDGQPLTSVVPILSFDDNPTDAAAGVAAYIDNFQLEVSVPDDDPNLGAPLVFAFGELTQGGGPFVRTLTLGNSGAANTLTISGGTLGGPDLAVFSLPDGIFPLEIAPGATADIEVTFTPGAALGFYEATIDLASNDQNDPVITVALNATLVPPFNGEELIINGNFELGSLARWRDNQRFNHVSDPVHAGTGAAEFNLAGGSQWGEARLNTTSPPATLDDPQAIAITEEMIGKKYEYSAWYYRPATGGMAENDTVRTILRWNKINSNNHTVGLLTVGNIPVDTWFQVTASGVIPAVGGDGFPTTSVVPLWSFQDVGSDAVGGEVMYIDDVSLQIEAPPPPPRIKITAFGVDGGDLSISWESETGMLYRLRSETDLSAPDPASWPAFDPFEDIEATPPINTATFPLPADSERFFVVEQYPAPPARIYFDDFESGQGDWTVDNSVPGDTPATMWEFGAPDDTLAGGPAAANSGTNCFGTNLADNAGLNVMISLVSPVVDLTTQTGATLNFAHFRDIEALFDFGRVRILDADNGDAELAVLESAIDGFADWEIFSMALPPAALGKNVTFEFSYVADEINDVLFPGWYIDDVEVTAP